MYFKELIIFVVAVLNQKRTMGLYDAISNEQMNRVTNKIIDSEAIKRWTDVGVGLSAITVSADSAAIIEALKGLSGAIPYLGPFLSGLISMIPGSSDFDEIKNQLKRMDSHLFAIENKIDALAKLLTQTSILSYYKLQAEKINLVEMSYKRYIHQSTNITMNELIDSCERHNVLSYVYYLHRELTHSGILSLMVVMKDDYHLSNFQIWMKMLAGSLSQCMMLHTICMFAKYKNHPELNATMYGDISFFKDMSDVMVNVVKNGTNDIKENFFAQAKKEINSHASANEADDHTKFVQDVWAMLAEKYFWRYWFVASYDDELYGADNHWVAFYGGYIYAWFRHHDRNINVVHTNNNEGSIVNEVKKILNRHWYLDGKARCKYIYDYVHKRIDAVNSMGVVATESSFSAKWSKGIATVQFVRSDGRAYNVFVVAPEK